jgi:hypothetical protein
MDYSDGVKYTAFRFILLLGTDALGVVFGKLMLWVIASVLPASADGAKAFLISDSTGSVVAAITMVVALGLVFFDDAKKHAAYDDWDSLLVIITLMVMLMFFFAPIIWYNSADITSAAKTFYYIWYFPCRWVMLATDCDFKVAAAAGIIIIEAVLFVIYQISYAAYKKKHPFSFKETA